MKDSYYFPHDYHALREQGISYNYYLIRKMIIESGLVKYNKHKFILAAAVWSFRKYGYGCASLGGYITYLENKKIKRLYNTDVKLWYKLLKQIFIRDNFTCQYCGKVGGKLEGDHIIPISKGGTNDLTNLVTSCRKCNRQKKDKTVRQFNTWRKNGAHTVSQT